jgi:hypothetical protein
MTSPMDRSWAFPRLGFSLFSPRLFAEALSSAPTMLWHTRQSKLLLPSYTRQCTLPACIAGSMRRSNAVKPVKLRRDISLIREDC